MKLNWAERWVVNNPMRILEQQIQVKWFKKKRPLKKGGRILEVGCGRGAGARLIADAFHPSRLYALDLDLRMVQMGRKSLPPSERDKIFLQVGDALALPFESGSLDAVFGFGFLHHVVRWRDALTEIYRVLKPSGTYFIEELYPALYQNIVTKHILFHPDEDRFESPDLRQELDKVKLPIREALELRKLGILAVAIKKRA